MSVEGTIPPEAFLPLVGAEEVEEESSGGVFWLGNSKGC